MELLILGGLMLVVLVVLLTVFMSGFQKCPPNTALIVFGAGGREPRIIKGGGTYVLPLIQATRPLSLELMTIDVKSSTPFLSANGVPVFVEAIAQIKVDGDDDSIRTAAEQFLSKDPQEVMSIAHESLVGNLRAIVGSMEVEELIRASDSFTRKLVEVALPDFKKMGLTIVSFHIKEIHDSVGYIEQLGRVAVARAKQKADNAIADFTKS
jgi:flotillin